MYATKDPALNAAQATLGLLDCVDDSLIVVDSDGCIKLIKESAATLLQIDRCSFVGRPLVDSVRLYADPCDTEPVDLIGEANWQTGELQATDARAGVSLCLK